MSTETKQNEKRAVREDTSNESVYIAPDVNIFETKNAYVLEAEMPGVNKSGLEVTLDGNVLTLVGRRSDPVPAGNLLYRESRPVDFRRIFELDPAVDTDKIEAKVDQGVLTLTLSKVERAKPRKILVGD